MEKSLVQIAMDCCNEGHWQIRDQEPYVCFPCIDEIQKRARNAALEEAAKLIEGFDAWGFACVNTGAALGDQVDSPDLDKGIRDMAAEIRKLKIGIDK